ncbi:MAG: hypothetical protein B7X99_07790 [Rhizobiales bacterium 17-65-6]|nr:MAG: hypothetical protein B7Z30_17740 [Rhizobiales bacterium 12-68-15]OYZ99500.1 MAG: hypothetical protein B7X99_07790 [Rhizobiales bacterium 17-65-6]
MQITRRTAMALLLPTGVLGASPRLLAAPAPAGAFAPLEAKTGGRLGICVLDGAGGIIAAHRAQERFAMCSTFKLLLAAAVLARVDEGRERLDRRITYTAADPVGHSPVTRQNVAEGMTVGELCAATVALSDNGAANLLLATLGGPEGLTAFLRRTGDTVTRLDRWELALNSAIPGDPRDTSTPAAMAGSIRRLVAGTVLKPASRTQLRDWLVATKTGDTRLRAGLPGWHVGDKTGTGNNGTVNDVGFALAPGAAPEADPVVMVVFLTKSRLDVEASSGIIADVARQVAGMVK